MQFSVMTGNGKVKLLMVALIIKFTYNDPHWDTITFTFYREENLVQTFTLTNNFLVCQSAYFFKVKALCFLSLLLLSWFNSSF